MSFTGEWKARLSGVQGLKVAILTIVITGGLVPASFGLFSTANVWIRLLVFFPVLVVIVFLAFQFLNKDLNRR